MPVNTHMTHPAVRWARWLSLCALLVLSGGAMLGGCSGIVANRIVAPPNAEGPNTPAHLRAFLADRMALEPGTVDTGRGDLAYLRMAAKPMALSLSAEFSTRSDGLRTANIAMTFEPDLSRETYPEAIGTIISLHGFGLEKESMPGYASLFADAGFDVYLVDLPGHGESDGEFVTYSVREAEAVGALVRSLRTQRAAEPIVLFGVSFGAAVAVRTAATTEGVSAVIAIQPFEDPARVIPNFRHRTPVWIRWALSPTTMHKAMNKAERKAGFSFAEARIAPLLVDYTTPTLLLHSEQDALVPAAESEALAFAAPEVFTVRLDPQGLGHESYPVDVGQRCREFLPWLAARLDLAPSADPCPQIVTFDELRARESTDRP